MYILKRIIEGRTGICHTLWVLSDVGYAAPPIILSFSKKAF
jgi:hypothetical protein